VATVLKTKKSTKSGTYWVRYFDAVRAKPVERDSGQRTKPLAREQARVWEGEAADRAERMRRGLLPSPRADAGGTVHDLMEWWLEEMSRTQRAHKQNVSVVRKHISVGEIASMTLEQVTPAVVDRFLRAKERETSARGRPLSAQTVKHIRNRLSGAFEAAVADERWHTNPVAQLRKPRRGARKGNSRRVKDFLRADEVLAVMAQIPAHRRPLFVVSVLMGLRKGEGAGLRKQDVDLVRRTWCRGSGPPSRRHLPRSSSRMRRAACTAGTFPLKACSAGPWAGPALPRAGSTAAAGRAAATARKPRTAVSVGARGAR
jgi:hypothetical protein